MGAEASSGLLRYLDVALAGAERFPHLTVERNRVG